MSKLYNLIFLSLFFIQCSGNKQFNQSKSGLEYKFISENKNSENPKLKDIIEINVKIYSKDTLIFNSSELSSQYRIELLDTSKGLIYEAISMMHVGDSAHFLINAANFYTKSANIPIPQQIRPNEKLLFVIRLDNILTPQQLKIEIERYSKINNRKEQQALEQYLKINQIEAKPFDNGVYIIETKKTNGIKPQPNDTVKIVYNLKIVNINDIGRPIISNKFYYFIVNDTNNIEGLNFAIQKISLNTQAIVIIPSSLGYSEKGVEEIIPPYSTLVFDLKLVEIKKSK